MSVDLPIETPVANGAGRPPLVDAKNVTALHYLQVHAVGRENAKSLNEMALYLQAQGRGDHAVNLSATVTPAWQTAKRGWQWVHREDVRPEHGRQYYAYWWDDTVPAREPSTPPPSKARKPPKAKVAKAPAEPRPPKPPVVEGLMAKVVSDDEFGVLLRTADGRLIQGRFVS